MEISDEWQLGKTTLNLRDETTNGPCDDRETTITDKMFINLDMLHEDEVSQACRNIKDNSLVLACY